MVDTILEKNFWQSMASLSGGGPSSTVTNADLLSFLDSHPQISVVSSYHLRPPKPQVDSFVFFDIFLLRHPLDRLYSVYKYHKQRRGAEDPLGRLASTSGLGDFVQQLIAKYPHLVNDSLICCMASAGRYFRPPGNSDLEQAVAMMEQAALPATTSLLDMALASAEYYLRPAFGELDLSYVAPPPSPSTDLVRTGAQWIKQECTADTYAQVLELTNLDVQLLDRTAAEVRRRFNLIPECEGLLTNFRQRCTAATEYFLEYDDVNA